MSEHGETTMSEIERQYSQSEVGKPFWAALARGRLEVPYCDECEKPFFFPRRWCPTCHSASVSWVESNGLGTIFTLSEVHMPFERMTEDDVPFTVLLVDLDEGVRLPGRLRRDKTAKIGDRVQLEFTGSPDQELPAFVPISDD